MCADVDLPSILLAAQPIYDGADNLRGVELLYRDNLQRTVEQIGDERATSQLIVNLCAGITEQIDHYQGPAFINVCRDFLMSRAFLPLEPDSVVIELVERIKPTPELIEAVAEWHAQGFRFALDDFEFHADWEPLLQYASVIKVDVLDRDVDEILAQKERLGNLDCQWLAERVEDESTRNRFRDAGFTLFQGYFLARPREVLGTQLNPSALHMVRVINTLFSREPQWAEIAEAIAHDPGLAISLIRIANSPLYRSRQEITSLEGVVRHLGLNHLRRWAALITSLNASSPEAARLILWRAQFCQELAEHSRRGEVKPEQAFLVGLLSGADILLNVSLERLLDELELGESSRAAILHRRGAAGAMLARALHVEQTVALKRDLHQLHPRILTRYRQIGDRVQMLINQAS
ncbi:HDOD domain-containing protein [Guyparkeria hydrothermalis]|uniref:EAL and HDOD domain-containing protein n=1 Tax=Guyparkeria TaxID=2035712 RepID=UPI00145D6543|nr:MULTISPECIES: HDOD domain-containing protein [Guyparkeria]MCL7751888.1 HDOD domain-containing protein [Guyparkeria hydrothermalis]